MEEVSHFREDEDNLKLRTLDELFFIVLCKLGKVKLHSLSPVVVGIDKLLVPGGTRVRSAKGSRVLFEFVQLAVRLV